MKRQLSKKKTQGTIKSSLYGLFSSLFLQLFVFCAAEARVSGHKVQTETKRKTLPGRRLAAGSGTQLELLTIVCRPRAMIGSQVRRVSPVEPAIRNDSSQRLPS